MRDQTLSEEIYQLTTKSMPFNIMHFVCLRAQRCLSAAWSLFSSNDLDLCRYLCHTKLSANQSTDLCSVSTALSIRHWLAVQDHR